MLFSMDEYKLDEGDTSLNLANCSILIFQLLLQLGILFFHMIKLFAIWDVKLILPSKVYLLFAILLEGNLPAICKRV